MRAAGGRRFPSGGASLAFSVVDEQLRYEGPGHAWHHRAKRHGMLRPHRHADLEVNLAIEGRAAYLIDGHRIELAAGTLLFLHHEQDHLLIDESADFRMWLAVWRPGTVAAAVRGGVDAGAALPQPGSPQVRTLAQAAAARLARLFADVVGADGPAVAAGLDYLLARCRAEFSAAADEARAAANPAVVRAAQLLRADPGQPLPAVARAVSLSPDRLGRVFRAATGLTLVDYRTRIRLDRVCEGWTPGVDLLRLCLDAGFGSYSAFNRAFRRRYGRSPSGFLAQAAVGDQVVR
jgi:AraC-like DNA-binding protein